MLAESVLWHGQAPVPLPYVFAYRIGPWRDRPDLLAHFAHVEQFDQLLIRAGIRMLLIMSESGRLTDLERSTRATTMIVERNGG